MKPWPVRFLIQRVIWLCAASCCLPPAIAQSPSDWLADPYGPKLAAGTATQFSSFDFQNIDNINLMNGALGLRVPLGAQYAAGGGLAYDLAAYYSSSDSELRMRYTYQFGGIAGLQRSFATQVPVTSSNAGRGWQVHLGRLIEPSIANWGSQPLDYRDHNHAYHREWIYVAPDGTEHHFSDIGVHGEGDKDADTGVDVKPGTLPVQVDTSPHTAAGMFFSRDGSFQRLKFASATSATVEMPNGDIHTFERSTAWLDRAFDPNPWRLRRIQDRAGNTITLDYAAASWSITDRYGRVQRVHWEADPWFGGRVKRVETTAFGGAIATFQFSYTDVSFGRWDANHINSIPGMHGRLDRITRPDTAKFEFSYILASAGVISSNLISLVQLPSGGKLHYEYGSVFLPSAQVCETRIDNSTSIPAVRARSVLSASSAILASKTYLRQTDWSPMIPQQYCLDGGDQPFYHRPMSELTVAEFERYDTGKAKLKLSYFSVFPISRTGPNFGLGQQTGAGGWKSEDYGQPFTRDETDGGLFLSTRSFDCAFDTLPINATPDSLADTCARQQSTYLNIQQDYTVCRASSPDPITLGVSRDAGWECLGNNAHPTDVKTVFHDDQDHYLLDRFIEDDGFGHRRIQRTSGTISAADTREVETRYNAGRGVLKQTADGHFDAGSTWANLGITEPWILSQYTLKTIARANAVDYSESVCFGPSGNGIAPTKIRIRALPTDGTHDVLYENLYNTAVPGLPVETRIYGGDKQILQAGGLGCNINPSNPETVVKREFDRGVLKKQYLLGSTITMSDVRSVDPNSGLSQQTADASGNIISTYVYDLLGRITSITRSAGVADESFTYRLPGVDSWSGAPQSIRNQFEGSVTFSTDTVFYDELGRAIEQRKLHPESGEISVLNTYRPDGVIAFTSTPQKVGVENRAWGTSIDSDWLGRPVHVTAPDGKQSFFNYIGVRIQRSTVAVGTVETSNGVSTQQATTEVKYDRYGNVLSRQTPTATTTFYYDSLDRLRDAYRGVQRRGYAYDGRGVLLFEMLPEIGDNPNSSSSWVIYGGHNALGKPGFVSNPSYHLSYTYDSDQRITQVIDGSGRSVIENSYGVSGSANGRLQTTRRRNALGFASSGGALADGDAVDVVYFYFYRPNGSIERRSMHVIGLSEIGAQTRLPTFGVEQYWTSDALLRTVNITYPVCAWTNSSDVCAAPNAPRVVTHHYARDALKSIATPIDATTNFGSLGATLTYHPNGAIQSIAHANGRVDWIGIGDKSTTRLGALNLAGVAGNPATPGLLDLGDYLYDGAGNITKIGPTRFIYDLSSRLAKAYVPGSPGVSEAYQYDSYDNLVLKGSQAIAVNPDNNRMSASDLQYDRNGRLVNSGGSSGYNLTYTNANLASMSTTPVGGTNTPCRLPVALPTWCEMYVYDPGGDRVGVIKAGGTLTDALGFEWAFRDLNGKVLRTYTHSKQTASSPSQIAGQYDYIYAGDTLIASSGRNEAPLWDSARYYHVDHLGSVRLATNSAGAVIGSTQHFKAFGESASSSGLNERIVDWAGYEKDPNGLTHNLKERQYFSGWGRFLSPDAGRDGWNLYAYADNNPINRRDPSGRYGCAAPAPGARGFSAAECARVIQAQKDASARIDRAKAALRSAADAVEANAAAKAAGKPEVKLTREQKAALREHERTVGRGSDAADTASRLREHATSLEEGQTRLDANQDGSNLTGEFVFAYEGPKDQPGTGARGGNFINVNQKADVYGDDTQLQLTVAHESLHNYLGANGMNPEQYDSLPDLAHRSPQTAIKNPESLIQILKTYSPKP